MVAPNSAIHQALLTLACGAGVVSQNAVTKLW
jgi:hypothetical protein